MEKGHKDKKENSFLNLLLNIIAPVLLMMKGGQWFGLSPTAALAIALAFPISYGIYDLICRRKYNVLSILGFISILLTGGIGLLHLPKEWIAIKEAAIPLLIGIAVLVSLKTRYPLVRTLLFNKKIIDVPKVESALEENNNQTAFNKLLLRCTYLLSFSFLLSAVLNFALARIIIQSDTGTEAFTQELGKMTALSFPVIALPCTIIMFIALWMLFAGIKKLTGLTLESVLQQQGK
ncbi:MAG: MFS transporter [Verrucomicrobia bacterium CG_4_10_14_3_um_filter_43_23]|nr:MAG: MFS transporter [Verrucomicrobia bacterium CG1_02_43_26]PIP58499.1 MAG: MFS transporter [Verrucomicrobia bacterium CG22_combo_CG10-13_8_21_14_all_43_17]PIX58172.1 MAG: MFS transporter [Verrucomicrobia bacterium CG_4_10_14_3_um_filter_43_23]PIY60981.1 MAG: MFS transporter [Verrucomicrobia bacterium CG_4_10_14_0_8_um_filter_43_34]PJA43379.1 MAG: MFS transporter [Verrucomicrobia bacterium CG_4_9_14_3_um_filter_43_20]